MWNLQIMKVICESWIFTVTGGIVYHEVCLPQLQTISPFSTYQKLNACRQHWALSKLQHAWETGPRLLNSHPFSAGSRQMVISGWLRPKIAYNCYLVPVYGIYIFTSWTLSRALMWSSVSRVGDRPPCKQKIFSATNRECQTIRHRCLIWKLTGWVVFEASLCASCFQDRCLGKNTAVLCSSVQYTNIEESFLHILLRTCSAILFLCCWKPPFMVTNPYHLIWLQPGNIRVGKPTQAQYHLSTSIPHSRQGQSGASSQISPWRTSIYLRCHIFANTHRRIHTCIPQVDRLTKVVCTVKDIQCLNKNHILYRKTCLHQPQRYFTAEVNVH